VRPSHDHRGYVEGAQLAARDGPARQPREVGEERAVVRADGLRAAFAQRALELLESCLR
jgi:hypothetical protein